MALINQNDPGVEMLPKLRRRRGANGLIETIWQRRDRDGVALAYRNRADNGMEFVLVVMVNDQRHTPLGPRVVDPECRDPDWADLRTRTLQRCRRKVSAASWIQVFAQS